jgi:hypothetical protein
LTCSWLQCRRLPAVLTALSSRWLTASSISVFFCRDGGIGGWQLSDPPLA